MIELQQVGQILLSGVSTGAVYAMAAIGFSLVFGVTRLINLVQGEFVILGGLLALTFVEVMRWPLPVAILVTVPLVSLVGILVERSTLAPSRRLSHDMALIVTIGGAFVLRGSMMLAFGKDSFSMPAFSGERPILVAGIAIHTQTLWTVGTLLVVTGLLWWFFVHTYMGRAMRAAAQNPVGARLVGINLERMSMAAFGLSAALGAVAGVVITPLTFVTYDEGLLVSVKGFVGATVGGLGSFPGAILGGLALGLAEALAAGYVSSQYKDAVTFGILLLVMLLRPHGLLSARH